MNTYVNSPCKTVPFIGATYIPVVVAGFLRPMAQGHQCPQIFLHLLRQRTYAILLVSENFGALMAFVVVLW